MNELLVLALLIAVNACNATTYDSTNVGFELWFTSENTEVSDFELKIDGSIPDWLSGTLVRNYKYNVSIFFIPKNISYN